MARYEISSYGLKILYSNAREGNKLQNFLGAPLQINVAQMIIEFKMTITFQTGAVALDDFLH